MELGERLIRWWDRVRGRDEEPPTASPEPRSAGEQAGREIRPVNAPSGSSEFKLSVEDTADGSPRPKSRVGTAGFDPYSSDAGFAKPHGWDDVSHK
ncbi:MAG: hypothetical protein RL261_2569 [Pseudomonadota bacterium]|jgi:hypothetical protein